MDEDTIRIDAYVAAAARAADLPIPPPSLVIVREQFAVAEKMAAMVADFPLDEREEPAAVFTP